VCVGSAVSEPDVILEGKKTYLTYSSYEQPTSSVEYSASVQLVEENFELPTGMPARRDHIMEVLEDLQGIYIRATYWTASVTTRLSNVIQDDAMPYQLYTGDNRNLAFALTVEECRCPENYQGLSCEECAPGFYRIESGSHGGYCVPCQCHGHATECDVTTGKCLVRQILFILVPSLELSVFRIVPTTLEETIASSAKWVITETLWLVLRWTV
jgi:laminin alpha 3/5